MGSAPVLHFPHSYVLNFFLNPKPVKFDFPWVSGKDRYKRGKTHDPSKTGIVLGKVFRVCYTC